jgi:UDP-N-acetyl-2-amino-2-deoxyglucuronate dehydrogenase
LNRTGIGIVGLGLALKPHALALRDLADKVEVIGGFSPSAARRTEFAAAWQWPVADSFRALCADPRIDALLILTPPRTHTALAVAAANAGKHVLLEKPVAVDVAEATALVDAVERSGRTLGIVFQHRFRPGAQALRELLRAGALGDLVSISTSIRWWRAPAYFAQGGRGMKARDGGGVLLTQAIHTLDLLLDLVGPARQVMASCRTSPLRSIDTEDIACATVTYDNGAVGVIDATSTAYPGYPERIEIAGTRGSAVLEAERLVAQIVDQPPLVVEGASAGGGGADPMAFSHEPHRRLIKDFVDAIAHGRVPQSNGRGALAVHALIDAMLASSATGAPVGVARGVSAATRR